MHSGGALEELCQRLKASDRGAFEQLFRLLREGLLRYVRSFVASDAVAHDLVQDVFVDLWCLRERLDPSQPLKAYVYRMARNRAYRYLRDERAHAEKHAWLRREASATSLEVETQVGQLDEAALARRLHGWILALPARQREALLLSRYHDLSHQEIADIMSISPRTVNNHIMRALEHLHDHVQAFEPALLAS